MGIITVLNSSPLRVKLTSLALAVLLVLSGTMASHYSQLIVTGATADALQSGELKTATITRPAPAYIQSSTSTMEWSEARPQIPLVHNHRSALLQNAFSLAQPLSTGQQLYLHLSPLIFPGLLITDIIYPFHGHW